MNMQADQLTTETETDTSDLRAAFRQQRRQKWSVMALRFVILVGGLLLWEFGAGDPRQGPVLIDSYFVSEPSAMLDAALTWIERGELWSNILATVQVTVIGFLMGATAGMVVGFLLGVSPFWSKVLNPFVASLYSIPRLALIPLFLLWFGLGMASKLAMVIVIVFFLVFYNTYSGVRDVDQGLVNVMKVMDARPWHIHTKVTFPSAMVWIVTGLRVSVPYALVGAVTAEMLMSNRGMGHVIMRSAGQFNTAGVFAGIVILMVLALLFTAIVGLLESSVLRWKGQGQHQAGAHL